MYPSWSFRIPLRADVDPATVSVLEAVARDARPDPADLGTLHPVVARYLADWTRLLTGEHPPYVGPPVRLSRRWSGELVVSVELSQHDDAFANGGDVLWLWALQLVARPERDRVLIGHDALDRDDVDRYAIVADPTGVDEGRGDPLLWADVERTWAECVDDPAWSAWEG